MAVPLCLDCPSSIGVSREVQVLLNWIAAVRQRPMATRMQRPVAGDAMRKCCGVIVVSVALALAGCNRDDSGRRGTSASREAGRAAYELSQETKRAAEKAREDLRKAGNDARQGDRKSTRLNSS